MKSKSRKTAIDRMLAKCSNNTQRVQMLREALDIANEEFEAAIASGADLKRRWAEALDEVKAFDALIGALNVRCAEWERAAKANMAGWEAEREACAKLADSYGIAWGRNRDVTAELDRIARSGDSQIPSIEIADAIRQRAK